MPVDIEVSDNDLDFFFEPEGIKNPVDGADLLLEVLDTLETEGAREGATEGGMEEEVGGPVSE